MRRMILLLGMACIFIMTGCGEKDKTEQPAPDQTKRAIADLPQKETETAKQAVSEPPTIIPEDGIALLKMKNSQAFEQHQKGIVLFDHLGHVEAYDLSCGACHHDEKNQPLHNLRFGDPVQRCFTCHDKPGKPRRDPSLSPAEWEKEQLKYYYGAIHENCIGCHRRTKGPTRCADCHPETDGK